MLAPTTLFAPPGITPDLTIALIFGLLQRKLLGLTVIYGLSGEALSTLACNGLGAGV
jgi:hypothetical protein